MSLVKKDALLVVALAEENADNRLNRFGFDVVYTGVGKVNAALHLTRALSTRDISNLTVINVGSAGSHVANSGVVLNATQFFERDMDATALGFSLGQTPYELHTHLRGLSVPDLPNGICYTGDSFVTDKHPTLTLTLDIIDMEAYALARVCDEFNVPFLSLKFITDGANGHAAGDWQEAVKMASAQLEHALELSLQHLAII